MKCRHWVPVVFGFGRLLCAQPAAAEPPLVHEYFDVEAEDSAIERAADESLAAPDSESSGPTGRHATALRSEPPFTYGGARTPDSLDASYRIDRDTSRPPSTRYHDPFRPSIMPFKRFYAYDAVDEGLELVVRDKRLNRLTIGGKAPAEEDVFIADLQVDIVPGVPVRIPSVGPEARVRAARLEPAVGFELLRDSADNWFLRGTRHVRARLHMVQSIPRAVFGAEFRDVAPEQLQGAAAALPPEIQREAESVGASLGLLPGERPRLIVERLVAHFRSFAASNDAPKAGSGLALYRELSFSRKGVCRHRAYAFLVTALGLGIPARMVRNEAHAWVEVYDGSLWHRVDLGGAAAEVQYQGEGSELAYRPPRDPYTWPSGSDGGALGLRMGSVSSGAPTGSAAEERAAAPRDVSSSSEPEASPRGALSEVTLATSARELRRGRVLSVSGQVRAEGRACAFARVDIAIRAQDDTSAARLEWLGTLATDGAGHYSGQVQLPSQLPVGEYRVVAFTPGGADCDASAPP